MNWIFLSWRLRRKELNKKHRDQRTVHTGVEEDRNCEIVTENTMCDKNQSLLSHQTCSSSVLETNPFVNIFLMSVHAVLKQALGRGAGLY